MNGKSFLAVEKDVDGQMFGFAAKEIDEVGDAIWLARRC
jgi:hypothetical protein